jgi:hypothetical protein
VRRQNGEGPDGCASNREASEKSSGREGVSGSATNRYAKQYRSAEVHILAEYREARAQLNAGLDLLSESIELRERLHMGVLDLDEAKRQVADFNRAIANFLAARNERGRRP